MPLPENYNVRQFPEHEATIAELTSIAQEIISEFGMQGLEGERGVWVCSDESGGACGAISEYLDGSIKVMAHDWNGIRQGIYSFASPDLVDFSPRQFDHLKQVLQDARRALSERSPESISFENRGYLGLL